MSETDDGLICAYRLDGKGGASELGWADLAKASDGKSVVWIHLRRNSDRARKWLRQESGLDKISCDALLADETRPRCDVVEGNLMMNLRGINFNEGAEEDDTISVRLWVEAHRIITLCLYPSRSVEDIRARLAVSEGPTTSLGIMIALADRLAERMHERVARLDERADDADARVIDVDDHSDMRMELARIRRLTIELRRFVGPQRDALSKAAESPIPWLKEPHRRRIREVRERVTRLLDDLDTVRERAAVSHEEAVAQQSEQMNKTMYMLSIVATIFLPLSFLTGLLGINVGGIPGVDSHWAFAIVCGVMLVFGSIELWLIKRLGWI